jgi:hypothetical protein
MVLFAGYVHSIYLLLVWVPLPITSGWRQLESSYSSSFGLPDADGTNDSEYYNFYHSKEGRRFHEIGLTEEIPFDIVDGRKIYTKFSALNQPGKEYWWAKQFSYYFKIRSI